MNSIQDKVPESDLLQLYNFLREAETQHEYRAKIFVCGIVKEGSANWVDRILQFHYF